MEGIEFGMWLAHGEGKFINISDKDNIPLKYWHNGNSATTYPFNPNGSERGTAAISSRNGRHLAIMPHPERCFLKWQLPYLDNYKEIKESPWVYIFRNAYNFVKKQKKSVSL